MTSSTGFFSLNENYSVLIHYRSDVPARATSRMIDSQHTERKRHMSLSLKNSVYFDNIFLSLPILEEVTNLDF